MRVEGLFRQLRGPEWNLLPLIFFSAYVMLGSKAAIAASNKVFPSGVVERYANWLPFKSYTPDNELNPLPSASAAGVVQDNNGFIWMSVYSSALIRYDGHAMESYTMEDGLPSIHFEGVTLGPYNRLWVATHAGLAVSTRPLERFGPGERVRFSTSLGGKRLVESELSFAPLVVGESVVVWSQSDQSLLQYKLGSTGEMEERSFSLKENSVSSVNGLALAHADEVVVASNSELLSLDLKTGELTRLPVIAGCKGYSGAFQSSKGAAWVLCLSGALYRRANWKSTQGTVRLLSGENQRNSGFTESQDVVYFTNTEGLFGFDHTSSMPVAFVSSRQLGVERTMRPSVDREGNLWIGSNAGFRKLSKIRRQFSAVSWPVGEKIFDASAFDVTPDGWLLVGGYPGLGIAAGDEKRVLTKADGLPAEMVDNLMVGPAGRIYLVQGEYYTVLSPKELKSFVGLTPGKDVRLFGKPYRISFQKLGARTLFLLDEADGHGACFVAGRAAVIECIGSFGIRRFGADDGVPHSVKDAIVDADGYLWLSTSDSGLLRSNGKFRDALLSDDDASRLIHEEPYWRREAETGNVLPIYGLIKLPDGIGLGSPMAFVELSLKNGEVTKERYVGADEGLASSYVYSGTFNEKTGMVYLGGNSGVSAYDFQSKKVVWTGRKRDGLLDNELWWFDGVKSSADGAVYFGTPKGIAIVRNFEDSEPPSAGPTPVFRQIDFRTDDTGYNELNVTFAALSFSNEQKVQYQTRIGGYSDWSEPGFENRVRLMNLPAAFFPKAYVLEIRSAMLGGEWSEEPLRYTFTVKPAWWLRWDFLAAVLLVLGLIIVVLRRQRHEALIQRDMAERYAAEANAKSLALKETFDQLDEEHKRREVLQAKNAKLEEENDAAARQLIQADKLATLGTMVAGVAHDIANPTGLIKGAVDIGEAALKDTHTFVEELVGDDSDEAKVVLKQFSKFKEDGLTSFKDIKLAGSRIAEINAAIRNQARVDVERSHVKLRSLVEECLTITRSRLRGIEIEIRCPEEASALLVRSQFGQVIMNLLSNAADAIFEEAGSELGRIIISAQVSGNALTALAVEDSGPGIPVEHREKVLETFYTTKEVGHGTGLGMSIVVRILELHAMKLSIEDSEELGGAKMLITPL